MGRDGKCDTTGGTSGPAGVAGHFEECWFAVVYFVWSDHQGTWQWDTRQLSPISTDWGHPKITLRIPQQLAFQP